jgi:hypothetical protein
MITRSPNAASAVLSFVMTFSWGLPAAECDRHSLYFIDRWFTANGISDWFGDPDGDGVPNYVEFGYNTNPLSGAAGQGRDYVYPKVRINQSGRPELVILQPDFPCGGGGYGRHWFWISVTSSTDLQSWQEIALKAGANSGFEPREGYSVTATKRQQGDWEIVIGELGTLAPSRWYRLTYFIVS